MLILGQIRRVHQSLGQINTNEGQQRNFGQPTPLTHPHLVSKGHVLPNISADELANRREKLSQLVIDAMKKKHSDIKSHMVKINVFHHKSSTKHIKLMFF